MTVQLGWLDTNIFVHTLFPNDWQHARCQAIVNALETGAAEGWIDLLVVHELTYVLGRLPVFRDRAAVARFVRNLLLNDHVIADDKAALLEVLVRWSRGVSFADARLTVLAHRRGLPVCSANIGDFLDVANTFSSADL